MATVVTGFNEMYWQNWGLSWLISLRDIAKFDGNVTVISYDLPASIRSKIIQFDASVVGNIYTGNYRRDNLRKVSELAEKEDVYAYWDADVYFQSNINVILETGEKFTFADNLNTGFMLANSEYWAIYRDIAKLSAPWGDDTTDNIIRNFGNLINKVDNTWNFTDIVNMHNDPVVVHPSGPVKSHLIGGKVLFWEKYPDLYQKHLTAKKASIRKLVGL